MRTLLYILLLSPLSLFAQDGSVYGIATYQSIQTQETQVPDNGSIVYVCDSAQSGYNQATYYNYIKWRGKVISDPPYGHRYIGGEKLKAKEIRALFAESKLNQDSILNVASNISLFAKKKSIVDRDGKYEIIGIPPGSYYVMIKRAHNGLIYMQGEFEIQKVVVKSDDKNEIDFEN